jgi:hypothetical protein
MATERQSLLNLVVDVLDSRRVPCALIGAAALAVHGISRSTFDIDLLVTDRRVLDDSFWIPLPASVAREIRVGDAADPLAGVIRFSLSGERDIDIVVGRGTWDADIVARAEATTLQGRSLPTARVEDVILLKLYAGGSQDRWDIEQLLARPDRDAVVALVDRHVGVLPSDARRLWSTLRLPGR